MSTWPVKARKLIDRLTVLWAIRLVLLLSKVLPYTVGVRLGGCLGGLGYYLLPRERKRAHEHLTLTFGDRPRSWIARTARACFVHLGKSMLEMMLISAGRLPEIARFEGLENLEKAMAQGKGVIYVTGHIGNWELSGGVIASRFPLSVVAAPLEPEPLNDLVVGLRNRIGIRIILRGRPGSSRELIRVFKENRILGLLIDQDTDVEGAFVDFLGRPAWTPTAAASMAVKFGAPVVFGFARRDRHNRHTVTIEGPLELIHTGNAEQDIIANTALFNRKIGDRILQEPGQWVWMHRRWRKQP
jgi:KDO2-lipid IV(A) lauroyltransferase